MVIFAAAEAFPLVLEEEEGGGGGGDAWSSWPTLDWWSVSTGLTTTPAPFVIEPNSASVYTIVFI